MCKGLVIIQKMKIVGIEIFQKYHQSCTIALKGMKMIRITRSIDLACLCFCLATRYCNSVFYTVLLQYILEDCIKNKKHEWILEKIDFLFFIFSYENSATYDHFWFFFSKYLIFSYENSATYEHFWFFPLIYLAKAVTCL